MLFINSLGVTILLPLNSSKGKCLLLPVIIKSALAFMAHSKTLLSGSSALSIFNRLVGVAINAFRLIFPISSAICFWPNLKRGLLRTASYSFKSAGETKNLTLSSKPNQTYFKFPQYILPLRRGRTKVGVDKIDPPPLHPLPRWGGEFLLEIFKVLEINSQILSCKYLKIKVRRANFFHIERLKQ